MSEDKILTEDCLEIEEEDPYSESGYTSCGACCGYGCDWCMPDIYLEEAE